MDFTRMGDSEIAGILSANKNVCARIKPAQADRELIIPHHRKNHAAAIAAVAVLAVSPAISYSQTSVQTEQQPIMQEDFELGKVMATPLNMINGTVTDEFGLPLPTASVYNKTRDVTVSTDLDGNFSITAQTGDIVQVSYIGYEPLEIKIKEQDFVKPLQLSPPSSVMGEVVFIKHHGFLGRIFYRIGNLFR